MYEKNNSVFVIIFLLFFNIAYALLFSSIDLLFALFVICSLLLFVSKKVFDQGEQYWLSITACWVIGLLYVAIVYAIYIDQFGKPYWMPGEDDYNFDVKWSNYAIEKGYTSINQMMKDRVFYLYNFNEYILFITYLKRIAVFGYHTMTPRVINIGLLILSSILMCGYIQKKIRCSNLVIKRMIFIMSLFPNALFISSHVYRDQICAFIFVVCFYIWSDFFEKSIIKKTLVFIITLFLFYCGYWFRATNIVILLFIIAISLYNEDSWTSVIKEKINVRGLIVFFGLCSFFILLVSRYSNQIIKWFIRYNYVERGMINFGRLQKVIYGVPIVPFGWIFRIVYYLLNPFDSHMLNIFAIHEGRDYLVALTSLGTLGILFLYPYVIRGVFEKRNNLVFVFLVILFSCGLTTSGFRHMITFYPFMFALGLSEEKMVERKKRKSYMSLSTIMLIMMICFAIYIELS